MDPPHKDSPMETGDLSKEEEAALFCRNPGEDEEPEKEIPCAQVNHAGACEKDQRTADRGTKSQAACTSGNIEQKQPHRQETFPRRARKVRENSRQPRCNESPPR